jgi:V/A-type H+-transporting ATPase subunit I
MFRPVPLVRVNIHVLDEHVSRVSWTLARLGVLHLVNLRRVEPSSVLSEGSEADLERRYRGLKERSKRLLDLLGVAHEPWEATVEVLPEKDLVSLEEALGNLERTIPPLFDRCQRLTERHHAQSRHVQVLRLLAAADIDLGLLRKSHRFVVYVGIVPTENLTALEESCASFPHVLERLGELAESTVIVMAFLPDARAHADEVLKNVACEKVAMPDREVKELLPEVEREAAAMAAELQMVQANLQDAVNAARRTLFELRQKTDVALALLEARRHFGHVGRTCLISGWVPKAKVGDLQTRILAATGGAAYVEVLDPEEVREVREGTLVVPILFSNPFLLRPFEKLITAYGVPQYQEVEPTAFLAISFLLMFGVMFGDVGQGLVLAGAGYGIFRTLYHHTDLGILLMECGVSSMLFGFLYGSVFGLEDLIPPLWFHPMHDLSTSLTVALSFGAGLISIGLLLNVINSLRSQELTTAIFGERGLMGAFIYWVCLAVGTRFLLTGELGVEGRGLFVLLGLPVLIIVFHRPVEEIFRHRKGERVRWGGMLFLLVEALVDLGDTFLAYLANTVSFVRISAFALAHVGLFTAVFALAENLSGLHGSGLVYWLTLFVGNVFIILLEGLVASIQAIRLEYYEFFGKFFKGGGEVFRPLQV